MTDQCPQLDLYPILEGEDSPTTPRVTEDNFRSITEWSRILCSQAEGMRDRIDQLELDVAALESGANSYWPSGWGS